MLNVNVKELVGGRLELLIEADAPMVERALGHGVEMFLAQMGVPMQKGADPVEYLKTIVGEHASDMVKTAVMGYLIPFAITEAGRFPVAAPDPSAIGAPVAGAPFAFTITFCEKPVLELSSYEPVEVEIEGVRPVTDEEVQAQIQMLAQQFVSHETDPESGEHRHVVPEVTDEWVKQTFGAQGIEDVASLREAMRQAGEQYQADAFEQSRSMSVVAAYGERLLGEIPDSLIDDFADEMAGMMQMQIEGQGTSFQEHLASQGMTVEQFNASVREQSAQALRDSFALDALFRHAGLELTEDALLEAVSLLQPDADPAELLKQFEAEGRMFMVRENAERMAATQWALEHAIVKVI